MITNPAVAAPPAPPDGDDANERASQEGRSRSRRMVRHFASICAGLVAIVANNLLLVPVLYRHLGPEAFGVWALFAGIQVMLGAADLGNALVHRLTTALAVDDRRGAARLVAASLVATGAMALAIIAAFAVASLFVDWASVWNVKSALAHDARIATAVLVVAVAISLPAALADKLNLARQMGGRNGALAATVAIATMGTALVVVALGGGLPAVVAATTVPNVVVRLSWLIAILVRDERVRPAWKLEGALRSLLRASAAFTILQACAVISYNSDQVVVARILGPLQVAHYAVPAKAFAMLLAVSGAATAALWPAFLEAVARRDIAWVRAETRRVAGWTILGGVAFAIAFVTVGPRALSIWVGRNYHADKGLLLAFACWGLVYVFTNALGFIHLSVGSLRRHVALAAVNTFANVGVSVVLTQRIGVSGAVWGSVITSLCIVALPLCLLVRRGIRSRDQIEVAR